MALNKRKRVYCKDVATSAAADVQSTIILGPRYVVYVDKNKRKFHGSPFGKPFIFHVVI